MTANCNPQFVLGQTLTESGGSSGPDCMFIHLKVVSRARLTRETNLKACLLSECNLCHSWVAFISLARETRLSNSERRLDCSIVMRALTGSDPPTYLFTQTRSSDFRNSTSEKSTAFHSLARETNHESCL